MLQVLDEKSEFGGLTGWCRALLDVRCFAHQVAEPTICENFINHNAAGWGCQCTACHQGWPKHSSGGNCICFPFIFRDCHALKWSAGPGKMHFKCSLLVYPGVILQVILQVLYSSLPDDRIPKASLCVSHLQPSIPKKQPMTSITSALAKLWIPRSQLGKMNQQAQLYW